MSRRGPDFGRIMDPNRAEHFVYRHFAAGGQLLYVGCSIDPARRFGEHKTFGTWAHAVAATDLAGPFTYAEARRLEAEAIQREDPMFNADTPRNRGNGRRRPSHFHYVFHAAVDHGETCAEAARLALIAVESEESADVAA